MSQICGKFDYKSQLVSKLNHNKSIGVKLQENVGWG